jgi:hypothetical protein
MDFGEVMFEELVVEWVIVGGDDEFCVVVLDDLDEFCVVEVVSFVCIDIEGFACRFEVRWVDEEECIWVVVLLDDFESVFVEDDGVF